MQAIKHTHENTVYSEKDNLLQGMDLLNTQLHTIDQKLTSTFNKEIQKKIQYQRQHIMDVQSTLLSPSSPLSLK